MKRWAFLFGLLTLAALADSGTWLLVPVEIRRVDMSPLRTFAEQPWVPFLYKASCITLCAAFAAWGVRARSASQQIMAGGIVLAGAIFWTYGAWTNLAYGVFR